MAHHKSALKRIKTNEKRKIRNRAAASKIKTLMKKVYDKEDNKDVEPILKEAVAYLDKSASKGRLHKNNAARKKSALVRYVNSLKSA